MVKRRRINNELEKQSSPVFPSTSAHYFHHFYPEMDFVFCSVPKEETWSEGGGSAAIHLVGQETFQEILSAN
jgi:hypothetical protein